MSHHQNNNNNHSANYATDPNTMFVQADPSNFRNIVQQLTGASPPELSTSIHKLSKKELAYKKLHERRDSSKKMELKVNKESINRGLLVSPVSHLDPLWTRLSPHSSSAAREEEKVIAEKGFYFIQSPRSGGEPAPELLPLFPLSSPSGTNYHHMSSHEDDYGNY
ncbi:unnamed protein product [Cochlearia groenlandica]